MLCRCLPAVGVVTELPACVRRQSQPLGVSDWLRGTSFRSTTASGSGSGGGGGGGAILRRAISAASRKSVRFADSAPDDDDAANKRAVHFAPAHRFVDGRDVTSGSGDDVTEGGGDGASEMSFTNSDASSSGLYVVNCGGYHVGGGVYHEGGGAHREGGGAYHVGGGASADCRPPIVAFRTFHLPPEGSLV